MRLCFCSSVRRTISVGCAVNTSSTRIEAMAAASAVGRDPCLPQSRERLGGGAALRLPVRIARMVAAAMHAVVLLGDVGQRQEMRERAGDGQRRCDRHVAQQPVDVLELAVERARPLGGLAHLLDLLEDLVPFVMPQHAPEHLPEQAHVVSQRLVRIDNHAEILSAVTFAGSQDKIRPTYVVGSCFSDPTD